MFECFACVPDRRAEFQLARALSRALCKAYSLILYLYSLTHQSRTQLVSVLGLLCVLCLCSVKTNWHFKTTGTVSQTLSGLWTRFFPWYLNRTSEFALFNLDWFLWTVQYSNTSMFHAVFNHRAINLISLVKQRRKTRFPLIACLDDLTRKPLKIYTKLFFRFCILYWYEDESAARRCG